MRGGALLAAILLAGAVLSLAIGEVNLGPSALWQGLWSGEGPGALTIRVIRGPRMVTALGAGAVLGLSGAILQTLLRNPLASPDILGFNAGAGLAVVAAVWFGLAFPLPLTAASGGLIAAVLIAVLSYRRGQPGSTLTLVLVGLGLGFFASALASFFALNLPVAEAAEAQRFVSGSLAARNWSHAAQVWGMGAVLILLVALQIPALKLLELGHDLATSLGLRVERARWALLATAVLLAAVGVAVAGPVAFVALMAMPLGVRLTRAGTPAGRLASAAGAGAAIMVLADLAARALVPGIQFPVGVATGILGAPYLLWRLSREMEKGEL